ncbi:hypothetical protein quinque_014368 [Culex quinquefasciatus]
MQMPQDVNSAASERVSAIGDAVKSFYYHASQDSVRAGAEANARAYVEIKPKTHYKVLFIRAPSVIGCGAPPSAEADANSLVDAAAVDTYQSAQPEVRFVNYKGSFAGAGAAAGAGGAPFERFEYNGPNAAGAAVASGYSGAGSVGGSNSFQRSFSQSGGVSFGASPTFVEQYQH